MNLNNIDDIFKEGLAGYSEQPSKGLWNKVSAKLLRYELFRLNFTNVPKLWVGFAAAGVVAVSLFVINPFSADPEENTLTTIEQKDTPAADNIQTNESIFIPTETQVQSNKEKICTSSSLSPGNVTLPSITDELIIISNTKPNNTITDQTQKFEESVIVDVSAPNNEVGNQPQTTDQITAISKPASNNFADNQTQPKDNFAVATDEKGLSPLEFVEEQTAVDPVVADKTKLAGDIALATEATKKAQKINTTQTNNTSDTDIESRVNLNSSDELLTEVKITELEIRNANLLVEGKDPEFTEIHPLDQPDISLSRLDIKDHESGKIQKMSSKSYQLGQFFQGKYKPPKRKFNENSASIYKVNKSFYSLAAYFSPEITEYARMASSSREISYIGGLSLTYNNAKFIIEGGLEYNYTNDLGDYMVDMQTFDSIGYYNEVGGFVPDPDNPGQVIFETYPVMVYDSVQHNLHQQTQNHYSYLQIPLMIGYQAVERGLFSAYIKAGPSFSFLLNKQEQTLDFYNPDATVNLIENYTPVRMNTSIQVLVSVRFKFQLNEKFGIMAEPTYRYYLKSVYDNTDNTLQNPYGIGLRFGLYYDL
jgi:hypothetical protein